MLTKFETESDRVMGLSFHTKRPWILASLECGVIQLWDYRMDTLIHSFDEHKEPVRGVHFHSSKPWFVSGGDDCKIKVWDYETLQCLFTLLGHSHYVRTVQFHHEYPWVVSASDDQTIRIWNWVSKTCISVLSGHKDRVTCASFHSTGDLILSASMDKTVRVWDFAALRKQTTSPAMDQTLSLVIVKHELRGHEKGVNWASFHPTYSLIVSASDDHKVKLWRMSKNVAWEECAVRDHRDSVSSVMFQAKQDIIVSTCHDKNIRFWGATKRSVSTATFLREHDKFLTLAVHPETSLLAVGHDRGLILFKHERKRPAFAVSGDSLFYAKGKSVWRYGFLTKTESVLCPIQPAESLNHRPRTLSYSPEEGAILIFSSDEHGGSYNMCWTLRKERCLMVDSAKFLHTALSGRHYRLLVNTDNPASALFVTKEWFAVLEKGTNQVILRDLQQNLIDTISLPFTTDAIFYAGPEMLLCRSKDKVLIIDYQEKLVLGELETPFLRDVVWSNDMESVALLAKQTITIASKTLVHQCTLVEEIRVKSGAWDDNGVFIYTTPEHMKYCLPPSGESGLIRRLDVPIYITKIIANTIYCLDRDGEKRIITIDATECIFKLSLLSKKYDQAMSMIGSPQLRTHAMMAYLQQKGFPEIALRLAEDERIKFNLAIQCGDFDVAVESATIINEKSEWNTLGMEAVRQGNVSIAEFAYQQAKNFERLSFLYIVTGNMAKLSKLMKIAEVENNVAAQFHSALCLGDVKEQVKILENAGHTLLAYMTASAHGLKDQYERLSSALGDDMPSWFEGQISSLPRPPTPILCGMDWPRVEKEVVEDEEKGGKTVDDAHVEDEELA